MKNGLTRIVLPELLDTLPPQEPRALRSRLDLRRLNQCMNHPHLMAEALSKNLNDVATRRVVELGAGDGHFLLSVAEQLKGEWQGAEATLVDRLKAADAKILNGFGELGWRVRVETMSVSEWFEQTPQNAADAIVANLFLHHFQGGELEGMFRMAAGATRLFVALEPRRAWLPRLCGRFLWAIGCNSVTRHDAGVSIRAGFSGRELSAIWPAKKDWDLTERPLGLFSHLFVARRKG